MKKLLVLGIGNNLLSDDGVGVSAALDLMKEEWPENVDIIEAGTFTQDTFYLYKGYDRLLVLDVIHANHEPGTIYRLEEEDLIHNESQRLSLHDVDLIDSLKMAELLGPRPRMRVLGMEPADITTWNIGLTEKVMEKYPKFLEAARREIRTMLEEMEAGTEG